MVTGQPYAETSASTRTLIGIVTVLAAVFTAACGSTSVTNLTGPDAVRCAASLTADPTTVPADGATVTVTVASARDCTWTARSDASWLQVRSVSGQGDGAFTATAARNDLATVRSGGIVVNDQRLGITQEGRGCSFTLTGVSDPVGPAGGRRTVGVSTLPGCTWTAESTVAWIVVVNRSGTGPGNVAFDVAVNNGATREASITVGTRSFVVAQSAAATAPPCTYSIDRPSQDFPAAGGQSSVTVTTQPSCSWTVEGGSSWTTILTTSGTGAGEVKYAVSATTSIQPRSTSLTIAGRAHTITQQGITCSFTLSPGSRNFPAAGGTASVQVSTQAGCPWTASSNSGWTAVTTVSGIGPGEVAYTVQANADFTARTAAISIGGQTHTVAQSGAAPLCAYSIDPPSHAFAAAGGSFVVRVTTQAGCSWSATSNVPWAIPSQASGAGPSDLPYSVVENTSTTARSGTLTIAGQPHTVTQDAAAAPACSYVLTPMERTFGAAGGPGVVRVTTGIGCAWTAVSSDAWVVVNNGQGAGTADIAYTVGAAAAGTSRTATITVHGQVHTVKQNDAAPPPP